MPISVMHEPEHGQLVLCVGKRTLLPGRRLDRIVEGLFESLQVIRAHLDDDDIDYFGLDVVGSHRNGDEFNPSTEEAAKVWGELASKNHREDRLTAWLDALVELYISAANSQRRLRECGELELGAFGGSLLAAANIAFVPHYARLVQHFDPEDSVYSDQLLDTILDAHGYRAETEDLLIAWAVSGQKESLLSQLLPQLERHYGEFSASPFFKRLVEAHYRKHSDEWKMKYPGRKYDFDKIFYQSELDERAKAIVAELESTTG